MAKGMRFGYALFRAALGLADVFGWQLYVWGAIAVVVVVALSALISLPWYGVISLAILVAGLVIAWAIHAANKRRQRMSTVGADAIFQEEQDLSLKQIGRRWQEIVNKPDYDEKVIEWFVKDIWRGRFEDKNGNSNIQMLSAFHVVGKYGDDEVFLSRDYCSADRSRLLFMFARDCPSHFKNRFHSDAPEDVESWPIEKKEEAYRWLSNTPIWYFDEPRRGEPHILGYRERVLHNIKIDRRNFRGWLRATKRPVPDQWYRSGKK